MFRSITKIIASVIAVVAISGCAVNQHHQANNGVAQLGIVMQANNVSVASKNQETAFTAIGGVLGTVLANTIGKDRSWQSRVAITSVGATAGAAAANVAVKMAGMTPGQELIVLTQDRRTVSIIQPLQEGEVLKYGDPVYVIQQGYELRARKVAANDPIGQAFTTGYSQGLANGTPATAAPNAGQKQKQSKTKK